MKFIGERGIKKVDMVGSEGEDGGNVRIEQIILICSIIHHRHVEHSNLSGFYRLRLPNETYGTIHNHTVGITLEK